MVTPWLAVDERDAAHIAGATASLLVFAGLGALDSTFSTALIGAAANRKTRLKVDSSTSRPLEGSRRLLNHAENPHFSARLFQIDIFREGRFAADFACAKRRPFEFESRTPK
ncbi:MAG: hypothetical protein AAF322_09810 [Pseudomonadota bacterium]